MKKTKKVRSYSWYTQNADENGNIVRNENEVFSQDMSEYCGKIVEITGEIPICKALFVENDENYWYEWMFLAEGESDNEEFNIAINSEIKSQEQDATTIDETKPVPVSKEEYEADEKSEHVYEEAKKKIETKFSEKEKCLKFGRYILPENCKCVVQNNEIIVSPQDIYVRYACNGVVLISTSLHFEDATTLPSYLFPNIKKGVVYKMNDNFNISEIE